MIARRIARGSHSLRSSSTNTRLPRLFDIFSPSMKTIAVCIQWLTNGSPVAASLCARSHSWCGKIRSLPPPCRSIVVPSSRSASALHSMCQPGRPGPTSCPSRLVGGRRLPQHEVERVTAGADPGPVTVDDAAVFLARFAGGAVGVFEATRFATGRKNAIRSRSTARAAASPSTSRT